MQKGVKKSIRKNYKLMLGFVIGMIVSGIGVYAATTISSSNISYDNSKSGLTSTNLNGAIDELYAKTKESKEDRFVAAYTYNENINSSGYCMTGEEATCKSTDCYKVSKIIKGESCKAGDIILYKVNDSSIVKFHYAFFESGADTLRMISHDNIVESTKWSNSSAISDGAILAREALRLKTQQWTNIKSYGGYHTGIETNAIDRFGTNSFVRDPSIRGNMVTVKELLSLGCEPYSVDSCPKWVAKGNYWTSDWYSSNPSGAWAINGNSGLVIEYSTDNTIGVKVAVSIDPHIDV